MFYGLNSFNSSRLPLFHKTSRDKGHGGWLEEGLASLSFLPDVGAGSGD